MRRPSAVSAHLRLIILLLATTAPAGAQLSTVNYFFLPAGYEYPGGIAAGPDGALWFTLSGFIGRIDLLGNASQYVIPYSGSSPFAITAGSDGNLWFTDYGTNSIGRVCATIQIPACTAIGQINEYPVTTANSFLWGIAAGSDGALWFSEEGANRIGRITTAGAVTEYPLNAPNGSPIQITPGPDGALWFGEHNSNIIGRITTNGKVDQYSTETADSNPTAITPGPDGALWFAESAVSKLGRITTGADPKVTEFDIDGVVGFGEPFSITEGADRSLWFLDYYAYVDYLGQTTTGLSTTFGLSAVAPYGITSGPDGSIWVSGGGSEAYIGQAVPSSRRNGVDLSASAGVPTTATLNEFIEAGVQYAVVESPQIPDNGLAVQQLNALHDATIQTAAYCFLYFYQGSDPGSVQANNCLNSINGTAAPISFMALDVEDTTPPLESLSARIAAIQDAIQTLTASGIQKIVIYTTQSDWSTLTGDDTQDFSQYALWNAGHGSFTGYADPAGNYNCVTKTKDRINSVLPKVHGGTGLPSLELPTGIMAYSITSNVVTIIAANTFMAGQPVSVSGLQTGTYLNGETLTVLSSGLSSAQFTAKFKHKNVAYTADSGTAALVLFGGWQVQSGTQYDIGATGTPFACLFGVKVDFDVFDPSLFE